MNALLFVASFLVTFLTGLAYIPHVSTLGAALPQSPAVFETSLQSPITSSATTMTLTANAVRGGGALSGYNCFTIDEGSAQAEYACGTVSGTTVSSMSRGISPSTGTTTVSDLQFSHRRGANVKITDFPVIQILKAQANGQDTYPNSLSFDAIASYTSALTFTTQSNQLASVKYAENYANAVISGGSPTSTETFGGKVELGTALEAASSTDLGAAKPTVMQTKNATDTPQSGCASGFSSTGGAGCSVIAQLTGKIRQTWLDLTSSWAFTGTVSIAASSAKNLTLNSLAYNFPSVRSASSSVLSEDGSGNLTWVNPGVRILYQNSNVNVGTTNSSTTTLQTVPIPANTLGNTAKALRLSGMWSNNNVGGKCYADLEFGNGSASTTLGFAYANEGGQAAASSDYQIAFMNSMMYATSTTGQSTFTWGSVGMNSTGNVGTNDGKSANVPWSTMTAYNLAAATYIAFSARSTGATCTLIGATVELLSS